MTNETTNETETHTANGTTLRLTKSQRRVVRTVRQYGEVFVALRTGRQLEKKGLLVDTGERHCKTTWGGGVSRKGLQVFRATPLGLAFSEVLWVALDNTQA